MQEISQCFFCKHYQKWVEPGHYRCDAFEIIPREILFNDVSHKEPYPGDNGIQYEKKEDKPAV